MEKKYKLTEESITYNGKKLYRIEALKDFGIIIKGDKGGYVESERNLSQSGNCWVYANAKVYDNAMVNNNAAICKNAEIYENASIWNNVLITNNVKIHGNAEIDNSVSIYNNVEIGGDTSIIGPVKIRYDAKIFSNRDYIVFKNWWSSGRYFLWTRNNNMWQVGCFYGTGKELIEKAYKDSKLSGREYERVVNYVESILKDKL